MSTANSGAKAGRIARQPGFRAFAALAVGSAAACGDGSVALPLTRPPMVIGAVADFDLAVGDTATVEASGYFRDPDGDVLSFESRSSAGEVAVADVSGSTVRIIALAPGTSTVAITARDPEGRAAALRFEVTVPNRAPVAVGAIPEVRLAAADTTRVDVSAYFVDPDGEALSYGVASSDSGVAAVAARGDTIDVIGVAPGTAIVTVTARDAGGLAAENSFTARVRASGRGFDIVLDFDTTATAPRRAAVLAAAELWMSVLADTELPAVTVDDHIECYGANTTEPVGTIDDLMVLVEFRDIDGPGRTLAQAGVCRLREGSMLPFAGVAFFDESDFDSLIDSGDATELAVHEIAHALGFGLLWRPLGLLRDPALGVGAIDAHFVGPLAIAAFDAAGGTDYTGGAKVPVENLGGAGSANLHWRGAVLRGELMRPLNRIGVRETLSAITIQSMADLGYIVDVSLAEPYTLPGARAADEKPGRVVDMGDDVLRGPVQVFDLRGRLVRVLHNR
ncbi:MAG: hypothetical protein F4Y74_12975 [Gemmatimonadales bacterium]|nr:hypothetical protein [Gemmatimonadales bacterium]MYG19038.1 hypothetical protein [Gemmatimonadales bacterium]